MVQESIMKVIHDVPLREALCKMPPSLYNDSAGIGHVAVGARDGRRGERIMRGPWREKKKSMWPGVCELPY